MTTDTISKTDVTIDSLAEWNNKPIWVTWIWGRDRLGNPTKVLKGANGRRGASDDPSTWGLRVQAELVTKSREGYNLGIAFGKYGLMGIDFDHVRNPETGETIPEVEVFIRKGNTYTDISPSGTGHHQIGYVDLSKLPKPFRYKKPVQTWKNPLDDGETAGIEIYHPVYDEKKQDFIRNKSNSVIGGRYFTFTGKVYRGYDKINDITDYVIWLTEQFPINYDDEKEQKKPVVPATGENVQTSNLTDSEIIVKIQQSGDAFAFNHYLLGGNFNKSNSDGDYGFCCIVAKHTHDETQIDRIIRTSKRENVISGEWDRASKGLATIRKAISATPLRKEQNDPLNRVPFPVDPETKRKEIEKVGDDLIQEYHIKRLDGTIHIFYNGIYINPSEDSDGNILDNVLVNRYKGATKQVRSEVLSYIDAKVRGGIRLPHRSSRDYIAFQNGLFNIKTWKLEDFNPEIIMVNQVPHDYNPDAKSKELDDFLAGLTLGDVEIINLLEEMAGNGFLQNTHIRKGFFLLGSGHNGKSTFLGLLRNMYGRKNTAKLDPKYLNTDKFKFNIGELHNKTVNIAEDISNGFIRDTSGWKASVSGEPMMAEPKGKPRYEFNPYATQIFSMNEVPKFGDGGKAIIDRMVIIRFLANFDKKKDPRLKDRLAQDEDLAEAMIIRSLNGLKRCLDNGGNLTIPQSCLDELEKYRQESDSVKTWLDDYMDNGQTVFFKTPGETYPEYKVYCDLNGFGAVSKNEFSRRVQDATGYEVRRVRRSEKNDNVKCFVQKTD